MILLLYLKCEGVKHKKKITEHKTTRGKKKHIVEQNVSNDAIILLLCFTRETYERMALRSVWASGIHQQI